MTPIILSAPVTLVAGAQGVPDLQRLIPPMGRPMLIHDISFTIATGSTTFFVNSVSDFQFGGIIRAKINAGRYAVTDGYVPLCNFAPLYSRNYDKDNPFFDNVLADAVVSSQGEFYNHWRWVLPKPLYMGPGEGIDVTFQRSAIFDSIISALVVAGTFTVRISVHGSLLFRPQVGKRTVPFVTCMTPTALAADGAYIQSAEHEMKNTLSKAVTVQRFVGHITVPTGAGTCITPGNGLDAEVEIATSKGYNLTHGTESPKVKWNSIFPEQRKAWTFNSVLEKNEKYVVAVVADTANSLNTVSWIGSREEEI